MSTILKKIKFYTSVTILTMLLVVPSFNSAFAQYQSGFQPSFQAGMRAFAQGDNELAAQNFLRTAHEGDKRSQYYIAYLLDTGQGMSKDPYGAVSWYIKSAEQNYLPAQSYLGYAYSTGRGVTKSDREAFKWYTLAARRGDPIAQNNLATMLRSGRGYKKDEILAAQWYMQSALQGNARAQYNVATMYLRGAGVKQNHEEALRWYEYAARQGDMYAQAAMAYIFRKGLGTKVDYEKSVAWYLLVASRGLASAQYQLARLYEAGLAGDGKGDKDAIIWYEKAAKSGHAGAQFRLGEMLERGLGAEQDVKGAISWYKKADAQNYLPASVALAKFYVLFSDKSIVNMHKAKRLYEKAASYGYPNAQIELARIYSSGKGIPKNNAAAYKWFALAAMNARSDSDIKEEAIVGRIRAAMALDERQEFEAKKSVSKWKPKTRADRKNRG